MLSVIRVGSLELSSYWLMLSVGTVGMLMSMLRRRERYGLGGFSCIIFTLLLTVTGVAGAKLLFLLENWKSTLENGPSLGGVSFFGSVFMIPVLMPLIGRTFRLPAKQTLDICGPCVAIMIGCMRIGCFLSGCCGGWEACFGDFCFRWPTQAIESIVDFGILTWLTMEETETKQSGMLYPKFMVSYSSVRFLLEFLRDTPKDWLLMSHGQWFSLVAILIGGLWLVRGRGENNT